MENYLLSGLGILVSILLSLVGYRQTIGAKKERIGIANTDIEKILIRRIVNENYKFNLIDISRLIEGKARDYKVQINDLLSEAQILNCIYTRIIETDFITQQQREEILAKIIPIMDDAEGIVFNEEQIASQENKPKRTRSNFNITLNIAVFASLIGTLLSTFLSIDPLNNFKDLSNLSDILPVLIATASISFAIISFIFVLKRFKESQQEISISSSSAMLENAINFEKEVAKVLKKKFNTVSASGPLDKGYDFIVDHEGQKILIEVKSWTRPAPNQIIELVVNRLNKSVVEKNASHGIIVTNIPLDSSLIDLNKYKVRLLTLSELKKQSNLNS